MTRRDTAGRILALSALAVVLAAILCQQRSQLAGELALSRPVHGLLSARFAGQGKTVPPALYYLIYSAPAGALELVLIPPAAPAEMTPGEGRRDRTLADVYGEAYAAAGDPARAARAMGEAALQLVRRAGTDGEGFWPKHAFWLDLELPPDARPAFPVEMKRSVIGILSSTLYWPKFAAAARALLAAEQTRWGPYDLLIAAREFQRIRQENIRLSSLPAPGLQPHFLQWLNKRANGTSAQDTNEAAKVEILNATEEPGVALKATKILRLQGFDVLHFGNSQTLQQELRVVDKTGRYEAARAVLRALGCRDSNVLTAMEETPRTDITVMLGRDYTRCTELTKS
ncbi:MAG: LytR C-terminal domain-containing protein [Elusimicrobiota bacterium]